MRVFRVCENKNMKIVSVASVRYIQDRGVRMSFRRGGYSFKFRPTHKSIDDTFIKPKFVG